MPTLNRSPKDGHYYIFSWYEKTWQISRDAIPQILADHPAVERYEKVEIDNRYMQYLKNQGWLYRKGEGSGIHEPWEYGQDQFFRILDDFQFSAIRFPELGIRQCARADQWEVGIVIPPISGPGLQELSLQDQKQLSGCDFSVDGQRFPASRLVGAPFFVRVAARSSPDFPISTKSVWPSSLDISALNCRVAPPKNVVAFMPPGTRGTRLVQPRKTVGDELVVLIQTGSMGMKSILKEFQRLVEDNDTTVGALREQPDWSVYWIRTPASGTRVWEFLSRQVGLQEARSRWSADLVLPLPISYGDMGELVVPTCDEVLVRIEHHFSEQSARETEIPNLVWEHGGKVIKVEDPPRNELNPHYLELEPPKGVRAATLWIYSAHSTPSSISMEFDRSPRNEYPVSLDPGMEVGIQCAESSFPLGSFDSQPAPTEIPIPARLDHSSIQAIVSCSDSRIPIKVSARSSERLNPVAVQETAFNREFIDYLDRMALQGQPVDVEFDAGGWGRVSVRLLPVQAEATPGDTASPLSKNSEKALVRWRSAAYARGQNRWTKAPGGHGRIATSFIRPKSIS